MNVLEKNSRGTYVIPVKSSLLAEREIFLEGDITPESADEFKHSVLYLMRTNDRDPINVHIHSAGGEIHSGLLIYDIIKSLDSRGVPVSVCCEGMAASMAAVILAGGPKGRRYLLPHSTVMIHEPLIPGGVSGSASSLNRTAETLMNTRKTIIGLLSEDTGKTKKEVERAIAYDHYMSAQEAVDFGIADRIITGLFQRNDGGEK